MLQSLLTASIELTAIAAAVYFPLMFALKLGQRKPIDLSQFALSDAEVAELQAVPQEKEEPAAPTPLDNPSSDPIVPVAESTAVVALDWAALDPYQLRQECQQRGIRWRNGRSDGKHLRKAEMVAALEEWAIAAA